MQNISKEERNIFNFDRLMSRKLESGALSGRPLSMAKKISDKAYFEGKPAFFYNQMTQSSFGEVQDFISGMMKIINNGYRGTMLTAKATKLAMEYNTNTR